ncbi:PD-(D/E)XK nuclease family protein [Rothia mucilaginosa]|uniref:PD-(D/E)XK nuclease family protein n=1 Tax=Rothia mucilaginosa TaxID=43675 RepID=UPI0034D751DD
MTTQLLTGIPGTGKTHHLTERALRYLADGNDPARLLILAPTRTAATRMRDTIAASSDRSLSVAPTRAWAAYAFDLLKRAQTRGLLSGVEGNLKLLSGPEQDVIIGELLANHAQGIVPGPTWPDVLRDALPTRGFRHEIRDFFDRMAEYDLTAEDVHRLATEHNQPAWHALAQLHTEYRAVRALRAKNAYDPAVLINDACRLLLRAPEFLAEERRRYDLILIDDVQELSPSIYRLLRLIAAEEPPADAAHLTETHPDLFAEGPQVVMTYSDEAVVQGFRGARPDLVTTLQASFPSMRTRTLTTSYRLPALMMPLMADIRRRLPRYTRFVPLTAEQEGANGGAQGGAAGNTKNGAPATFGRINTTPADEALTWGAADEPLLHLGADGKILDPAHYRTAPAGVYKYALASSQDEANLIAQMLLEERIYGNHPYRESAIIVRNGADVARIRRVLSSNGIPSRTSAALVPVRDEPAVRPFLDALSLLVYARKRGEKALNPAVHMPAGEGAEAGERAGFETLSAAEAEELMRRSLNDVIAEESRANPLGGAQSAITLLTSRLGGASSMDVRRLRQQLRSIELQSGGHRPSDDLLLGALLHPETLPEEGVGRAVHRIAAVLSAGRKALARPESTSTEVLWALWEASGLEKTWVAQSRGAGPDADAAHRNLDAMIGLFEAADRFDEQMRGAGAEQFLDFIDAQDLPMDTLAARGVRQDAVEILTPALAAGQSWRTVYVCGLQEGTWPNTTVRGSLLATGDLVDLCDARIRQRAQQQAGEEQVSPARIRSYPERVRDTRHDELRMFAVAATRASTRLVLTAVRNDDEAPGEFFDFVLPTDAVGDSTDVPITRVRRPATLRSLVAELRRTLVEESLNAMRAEDAQQEGAQAVTAPEEDALTPEASAYRLDAASRTLARLANVQAPGAAPDEWWGLLPLSSTELLFAHRPADRPADHAEPDENYGEEPAENLARRTIALSPSRLETIHNSPLDWLVSAARAEAQTDLSRSLGTLVHAIAEEYPTGTLEELQTALDERISSLGVPARKDDETDEEYRERVPWESYALYERAKRMILRLSYYYRQHMGDAGWQNLGVEGSFAVRVPVPFDPAGEVGELDALLTGRVDRLEGTAPAEDGTRRYAIVDLKTGKSKPDGKTMETHPQLAAYQIAVEAGAGAQLEERYRAEAAALEAGEPLPDARPQELEYTGYTGRSGGAALVQLGASGVNDESKTRLQVQPALTEHDSWAAELVQHAAELIAGAQVQARHREGGYGCRLPEICPICTRGRQVTQP